MRKCIDCKQTLEDSEFYPRTDRENAYHSYCKKCFNKRNTQKLRNKKKQIVEYMGGKCKDCGLVDEPYIYDFHHLDPTEKDFTIARFTKLSFEKLKPELDKCVMLCANCHRHRHYRPVV